MKKARTPASQAGTIVLVAVIFIAVLGGSILFQLLRSPDFEGFGSKPVSDPDVTILPGADSSSGGDADGQPAYDWQDHPVYIIGDSLTQGARKEIAAVVPDATIDGKVNRNMAEGVTILEGWEESGALAEDAIIVVCLAHNITDATLTRAQEVVDRIEPGQSLVMMTGHGRSNMEPINEFIRGLPLEYGFVTVADWDLTVAQSPGLLSDDGIHISKKQGNELYAGLILRALEVAKPKQQSI